MNEVIGTLIPLALGVALNPFPIILVVLLLGSAQPAANGLAFLTGWVVGLSAVVAVLTLVMNAFESPDGGEPSTITGIVQLLLGAGLLFLAGRKFTKRMRTSDAGPLPDGWPPPRPWHLHAASLWGSYFRQSTLRIS